MMQKALCVGVHDEIGPAPCCGSHEIYSLNSCSCWWHEPLTAPADLPGPAIICKLLLTSHSSNVAVTLCHFHKTQSEFDPFAAADAVLLLHWQIVLYNTIHALKSVHGLCLLSCRECICERQGHCQLGRCTSSNATAAAGACSRCCPMHLGGLTDVVAAL